MTQDEIGRLRSTVRRTAAVFALLGLFLGVDMMAVAIYTEQANALQVALMLLAIVLACGLLGAGLGFVGYLVFRAVKE